MGVLMLLLITITGIAAVSGYIHERQINRKIASGEGTKVPDIIVEQEECNACRPAAGATGCELGCILQKTTTAVTYYDDEELDRFKERPSNSYTDEEIAEFREILYTCPEADVPGWNRSLELRGIHVPDQLKDELYLLINDQTKR